MMNYIQISIAAEEQQQEILISILSELSAEGFEQNDTHLLVYFNEDQFNSYEVNKALEGHDFQINTVPEQNWNAVWESNFQPVEVDNFCAVRADFHEPINGVAHEVVITPKMSFGTGHHATTYMMLQQMRKIGFHNKSVFDFGTGTGILAILAKKLGAGAVTAIDVDDWSIENAAENFERNQVTGVNLYQSSKVPEERFDVILANINKNVILQNATALKNAVADKGLLLVSGLLKTDKEEILSAFRKLNMKHLTILDRQNWISVLFSTEG